MILPIDTSTGCWRADATDAVQLRLLATGDFCPREGTTPGRACTSPEGAAAVFRGVLEELWDKDLSVTNLECPLDLTGQPIVKDGPALHGRPEAVQGLLTARFDVACMANNHVRDFGPEPMLATMQRLTDAGVAHVGVVDTLADAGRPLVLERNGLKLALLAVAEHEFSLATRTQPGVDPLAPGPNAAAIAAARQHADLVVVFVHGGSEFCPFPSPRTVRDYRSLIDAGADALLAHHAHTPQGMELHNGRPILYNLGNFFFYDRGEDNTPYWLRSFFVRLHFAGRRCVQVDVRPFDVDAETGAVTLLRDPTREGFLRRLNRLGEIIADGEHHERLWNAYCLTRIDFYRKGMTRANRALDAGEDRLVAAARLRNMFTCQAHRDVIWTALELIRTGRDAQPLGVEDELRELMKQQD